MEENKIIRVSIIAVIIYFIGEKTYDLTSEIFFWISTFLQNQNDYLFAVFQIIAAFLGFLVLAKIFNVVFRRDTFDNKTIYLLLVIFVAVHGAIVLLNYKIEIYDIGERQTYLRHFALSKGIEFVFPIILLLYFFRKLWK